VYIGEGDPVGPRLKEHATKKEFWTQAAVFTSKDDYLTKTQIQFLESALVRAAKEAGRAKLDNLNVPSPPNISEADEAEVTGFFETIKLFLGVSGFHFLRRWEKTASSKSEKEVFHYRIKSADARMVRSSSDYIVLAGSTSQPVTTPSAASWVKKTRDRLMDAGILTTIPDSPLLQFSKDTAFPSPSAAAAVIAGGNQNGLISWRLDDGRTLKEVEES
jgi:hypothetical protein